jgi:alkanesulfonate monooxygenase SsuD/methylene tetrahydromethanopterin reductase-like flavin-dependent oxidoreductase (luciferase family)
MRIAAILAPIADWQETLSAAKAADEAGLDAIGLWDHYHSARSDWGYMAGWSAMGALAASTTRTRLVQMVVNNLHYEPGVLAKETATLAVLSGGRYELGIGAGDWPESFEAWGRPYPERAERLARLEESVTIVRQAWRGEPFDVAGKFNELRGACVAPVPERAPRVVVGVGKSSSLASAAVRYADELNLYADADIVGHAKDLIASSGREISLSLFFDWSWDSWPADADAQLSHWHELGIERFFVSVGGADIPARIEQLARL